MDLKLTALILSQNPNKINICFTDSSTLGCTRTDAPTKSPTLCAPFIPTNTAPASKVVYCGKGKGVWSRKKQH